jgi:ABC-type multidrug transport system ATPase subunit
MLSFWQPNNSIFASMNITHPVIELTGVSKKFGSNWIFRNIHARFEAGKKYAITGPNGSGKSTLLKIIAGIVTPNEGTVSAMNGGEAMATDNLYQIISYCAPYLELPHELTLIELLNFHESQRKLTVSRQQFIDAVQLQQGKEIRNYSSGMQQRLKLALAFYTQSEIILLDEPTSTLDEHWSSWYLKLIKEQTDNRLVIISSNMPAEYSCCDSVLDIRPYMAAASIKI